MRRPSPFSSSFIWYFAQSLPLHLVSGLQNFAILHNSAHKLIYVSGESFKKCLSIYLGNWSLFHGWFFTLVDVIAWVRHFFPKHQK